MNFEEKQIKSDRIYEGRIINLRNDTVQLHNGEIAYREVIEHNGGVCVAAITQNGDILLVKQFRYPYYEEIIEVPAGKLNKGEDPESCGKRELLEETGAVASYFEFLGVIYPSPGYVNEKLYLYLAKDLTYGEQNLDNDEFLEVIRMPFKEAINLAVTGEIKDAKSVAAIFRASVKLGYLETR